MSEADPLPPPVEATREREIRLECLRLAMDFRDVDIVEQAKRFADFVLGAPAEVAEEPRRKKRGPYKPVSPERKAQLMQQLETARAARKAKREQREAA